VGLLLLPQALLLQRRAHPRPQQHGVEGLGQVVLGAEFDPFHHVVQVGQGRDHDDRNPPQPGIGLDPGQGLEAVQFRHHGVEQDQVEALGRQQVQGQEAVLGHRGAVALPLQVAAQQFPVGLAVVHHQDGSADRRSRRRGLLGGGRRFRRGGGGERGGGEQAFQQLGQVPRGLPDPVKVGQEVLPPARFRRFGQQFAVADDLVEGGAQRVAGAAVEQGGRRLGHGPAQSFRKADIFANSRANSMGLVS
jgi:hypothetical protein